MKIHSKVEPATYRYTHHMGGGERIPAFATAWVINDKGKRSAERVLCGDDHPGLEDAALAAKAVAILRHQIHA